VIDGRLDEAIQRTYTALVETKIMLNSLKDMQEQN
jgi:hypothetical protein